MMPTPNRYRTAVFRGLLAILFLASTNLIAQTVCTSVPQPPPSQAQASAAVPGDRWMEIDLYWFEQDKIAESVRCFWDRFQPLYEQVSGDRGLILNVGDVRDEPRAASTGIGALSRRS